MAFEPTNYLLRYRGYYFFTYQVIKKMCLFAVNDLCDTLPALIKKNCTCWKMIVISQNLLATNLRDVPST